jgi:acyl-CoA dehydrogenase
MHLPHHTNGAQRAGAFCCPGPEPREALRMEFDLPPDLAMLREAVRRFVDEQLIPIEMSAEAADTGPDRFVALRDQTQAMGLWHLDVPEDLGGMGLGLLGTCVVEEEIARTRAFPARIGELFGPFVAPVLYAATGEQRARFLQPVLDGRLSVRFAASDLDPEMDPARLGVTARRDGDAYLLDGVQEHLSAAPPADHLVVFARIGGTVTCLLVGSAGAADQRPTGVGELALRVGRGIG